MRNLKLIKKLNKNWSKGNRPKDLTILNIADLSGDMISAGGVFETSNVDAVVHSWGNSTMDLVSEINYIMGGNVVYKNKEKYGGRYQLSPDFYRLVKIIRGVKIHLDGSALLNEEQATTVFTVVPKHHVHKYSCGAYISVQEDM